MNRMLEARLEEYGRGTPETRTHALREILQQIALYSLSMNGFFESAVFHGGTELRLIHGLPRFSEDLDFILSPGGAFSWEPFEEALSITCRNYGLEVSLRRRKEGRSSLRRLVLTEPSILGPKQGGRNPHLRIRLELDTDPPAGTRAEAAFMDFPLPFETAVMELSSSFALKCHALLCRPWEKGRDWFDLLWFCSAGIRPSGEVLGNAIRQHGPWAGTDVDVSDSWLRQQLTAKADSIDLAAAAREVSPFLTAEDRDTLRFWGTPLFRTYIDRIRLD